VLGSQHPSWAQSALCMCACKRVHAHTALPACSRHELWATPAAHPRAPHPVHPPRIQPIAVNAYVLVLVVDLACPEAAVLSETLMQMWQAYYPVRMGAWGGGCM